MRLIFPPKNLEKYGAQNTHAPDFFLFNLILPIKLIFFTCCLPVLLSTNKQVNEIKQSVFGVIFYCLSIYALSKPRMFHLANCFIKLFYLIK